MAFTKMGNFTFNHAEQPDKLNLPAAETKAKLDSRANELKTAFNAAVDLLNATAAGASGADNVGAAAISGVTGTTVQAQMESMKGYVDAHLADTTTAHGATAARTASKILLRDANGFAPANGLSFPATQVASADANTLDDYEEGTFTAELRGDTSRATTPVEVTGYYTKIGRQVTCIVYFNNVDTTGASGSLQVVGLPFASNSTAGMRGSNAVAVHGLDVPGLYLTADVPPNSTLVYLVANKDEAAWVAPDIIAGAGKYIELTVTYFV